MPIITAPVTPPDTGEPGGGGGGVPIPFPEIGFATATYTDPSGVVWPLTDTEAGWFTLAEGVTGLDAVEYELTTDAQPRGGARLRHAQAQPRTIVWPLYVYGDTHLEFVERWRALARAFTRTLRPGPDGVRPPGILEISRPDGSSRRINVFYQEGFEGQGKQGTGISSDAAVLTLWCEDPYWIDPTPIGVHRETGTLSSFFVPYPAVSSSQVLGATTVENPSDVTVWPTWKITGPASQITFTITRQTSTGQTMSESFTLTPAAVGHGNLLAGEHVTVSTDPPMVRFQDGANWIGALNWPAAVLWGLEPGANEITFQLDGSGPGSAVDLVFYPRYETA
ncbi:phage tail family protein [Streptomyces kebangsaanensis]|uniref:phage tail protein n=1 Tax=Streptomyces kebangsaanensis TaxID=864058 RepID=UPI00093E5BEE|nr:phage tail protein [Streptomyces kebangsaanensis]